MTSDAGSSRFTDREKELIRSAVKSQRFHSDEYYELYEKLQGGGENHACPSCESENITPVWKNPTEFKRGRPPVHLGCIDCGEVEDAKAVPGGLITRTRYPG